MLYLIGTGLGNEKSLSLEALEAIKRCQKIYLENYTSKLQSKNFDFEFIEVNRDFIENFNVEKAKDEDVAILIVGDIFSATTHISLFNDCKNKNVKVEVINNASILTAVGITGLELYKFGKVASIPFNNENIKTPIEILNENKKINAHTLFLLDLNPEENKYLSIKEAIEYLGKNNIKEKIVACSKLGSRDFIVKYGDMEAVKMANFKNGPYCLIIPGKKLHFIEEEVLRKWGQ